MSRIIAKTKTDLKVAFNQKKGREAKKQLLVSLMRENDPPSHLQNLVSTYLGKRV
jgi:predicted Zn-dependent peptidase